jgi:hypothetical protein
MDGRRVKTIRLHTAKQEETKKPEDAATAKPA